MRNIFINKEQYKLIKESVEDERLKLPSWLQVKIEKGNTPLSSDKDYINDSIKKLAEASYASAVEAFSDDITKVNIGDVENKLNKLILICQKKEERIKTELEKLCSDIVMSLFNLDSKSIELNCNLIKEVPKDKEFHVKSTIGEETKYDSISDIDLEDEEVIRRRYVNALEMGAALNLSDEILSKCLRDIFELDEELPHLYNKIIKINDYLLFANHDDVTDRNNHQDGYNEVEMFDNNTVKITSEAIIFPFLLTESIRGCIETITAMVLPAKFAEQIINKCDVLEDEPMNMLLGRPLWKKVCGEGFNGEYTENYLMKLLSLETEHFNELMSEVIVGTKLGDEATNKILDKIKYDYEYNSFEDDLKKKREEKGIIENGYFTEDELSKMC